MKRLVIIGGGFAGSYIAKTLQNTYNVTLIDSKDYFEFTPSILRTIVNPKKIESIQIFHKDYLPKAKFILGNVTSLSKQHVHIKEKKIPYDYLVIASGSSYNLPIKDYNVIKATRANNLLSNYANLCRSKDVIIVGGGLVGVELAAEIVGKYNDKNITLVQSGDKLIPRNNPKSISYVTNFLIEKSVNIIYGPRVLDVKNGYCILDNGDKLKSDIVFICTGISPNTSFLANDLLDRGYVKVNKFLQSESQLNIFSCGDVNNVFEEKTAQNAVEQAKIVVQNIQNLDVGKNLNEYISYKTPMIISLGKSSGVIEYKDFVMTGFLCSILKKLVEIKTMLFYKT